MLFSRSIAVIVLFSSVQDANFCRSRPCGDSSRHFGDWYEKCMERHYASLNPPIKPSKIDLSKDAIEASGAYQIYSLRKDINSLKHPRKVTPPNLAKCQRLWKGSGYEVMQNRLSNNQMGHKCKKYWRKALRVMKQTSKKGIEISLE